MSVCTELEGDELEGDESKPTINGKCRDSDVRDVSGSQDMFSDDEQLKNLTVFTPKVTKANDTSNSSIISLRTPQLNLTDDTPRKARVPRTPADLLPFITKTNVLWTSDMETPQSKLKEKSENCNVTENSIVINNTPPREQSSPNYEDTKTKTMNILTSPVLGGKKRSRRCAKRRILNNIATDLDNDLQSSTSSNSDSKIPSDTSNLGVNKLMLNNEPEISKSTAVESTEVSSCSDENKENKQLEDNVICEKNSNISTQEFFYNASFSSIDRLCSTVIHDEKLSSTTNIDNSQKKYSEAIKKEASDMVEKPTDVDNDVLERIASIKRNQKPIRRLTDINHTVIPKEIFSNSARELELANSKFTHEKKDKNIQPLKSTSFIKLSSLENNLESDEKPPIKKELTQASHDVSLEFMEDWSAIDSNIKKENYSIETENELIENPNLHVKQTSDSDNKEKLEECDVKPLLENFVNQPKSSDTLSNIINNPIHEIDPVQYSLPNLDACINEVEVGFSTARGGGITINEDKLVDYVKIYNEIENESLNENTFIALKTNKLSKLPLNLKKKNLLKPVSTVKINENSSSILSGKTVDKKSEKLKLFEELDLHEFLEPKFSVESTEDDGFSTAAGRNIIINEEKENYYSNIYNELGEVDENSLSTLKTNKILQLKNSKKPTDKALIVFDKNDGSLCTKASTKMDFTIKAVENRKTKLPCTETTSDGFSTARGRNIVISKEKENLYSTIYNKLSEEISNENSLLNLNKSKLSKLSINNKLVKTSVPPIKKNKEDVLTGTTLSISSDTDDVFYNLGDVEKLLVTPLISSITTEVDSENCFTVPDASHISKRTNQSSTINPIVQENIFIKEENIDYSENAIKSSTPLRNVPESKIFEKSQIGLLKRKLENCEPKRQERCRSFGGFPLNDSPLASKLNKSDPNDEAHVNQPLQKGLSVSQCFDPHSDSWMSKMEISYLNNSKAKSPEVLGEKRIKSEEIAVESSTVPSMWKSEKSDELLGFSFKDCTESFRLYASFEKFLRQERVNYDCCTDLCIGSGQTISIFNQTSSKQYFSIQHENNVNLKKSTSIPYNYLVESIPIKETSKSLENRKSTAGVIANRIDKVAEKRKHVDTDSDTPLTTLKKPRIGCELQGKKLFADESDVENVCSAINQTENEQLVSNGEQIDTEIIEEDLSEERLNATLQQEKVIMNKKRIKVKPITGSMLQERLVNCKNRKSWSDLVGSAVPNARVIEQVKQNRIDPKTLEITASNAEYYKFLSSNIIGNKKVVSLDVGDDANLIFDENGYAGVNEFTNAFLAMPGVDPKLLPTGWIGNHYRWIIWKLASMDRTNFNSTQLPKILTPERVMKELKYRYDREIDKAERPALRRILEKDDVSSRRMVLCISSIEELTLGDDTEKETRIKLGLSQWKIEATDGWYSIPLTLDNVMAKFILNGKIKEGTKIVTYGAELLDCERGFYPLEKPPNVSLKIHTNCTRRARWDTKLGFQQISRPIPIKLRSVIPNGGMVGQMTVVAARVYPLLYREKTTNGQMIYRNARSEEKAVIAHERACELKLDAMYAEAEKNYDTKKKSDSDEDTEDSQVRSESQVECLMERKQAKFQQKLESRVREGLPAARQVTPVLKVRLVDDRSTATLSIWGASEDSGYDIKEGSTITIYNAFASGARAGEVSLTANRFTHIKTETLLKLPYPSRTCTLIPDITSSFFEPKFNEFDTVGVVVFFGPAPHGMKNFEVVGLAYPRSNNAGTAYLCILFWNGVASFGYQGLFTAGAVVACSNLEWRRNISWSVPVAYCSEKSLFTSNPRQAYLSKEIRNLKNLVQNPVAYAASCADEIKNELAKKLKPRSNQDTPTSFHNNSSMLSPHDSPAGLSIQRRLEKLSQYGGVPDVSPAIVLNNSSFRVKKNFTPVTPRSN